MLKLFAPLGYVFGLVMYYINNLTHNYGITLILFTVLLKLLMVPLGIKQQKGLIANARIQPKMVAIQKMYGQNRERYSEELQKLYKEEHYSPMSSCLPTLIMFPILFGMLDVIYYPLKHMLRLDANTINSAIAAATEVLGAGNLNRYSPQISVLNAVKMNPQPFIDRIGAETTAILQNFDYTMFGLPLGEQPTFKPEGKAMGLYIALLMIPLLSGVFAYLMGKLSASSSSAAAGDNPGANSMMASMTVMMPLLSIWISFAVPAGVGIYWLLSNIAAYIQQMVLNKVMNPKEAIEKAKAVDEAAKLAEREARAEAKKRAREEAAKRAKEGDVPLSDSDSSKIAEARRRMEEKYGDEKTEREADK